MMTDYRKYKAQGKELAEYYMTAAAGLFALAYLFYESIVISAAFALLAVPLKRFYEEYCRNRRQNYLLEGFRDLLYSVSASCAAGNQMPAAMESAYSELAQSYGEDSDIARELELMVKSYKEVHADTEDLLRDLGDRSGLKEIALFASAYSVCKRNGGDLEHVSMKSAELILEKLDFKKETEALLAEKKMDLVILAVMPVVILLFLNMSSYDYIQILYTCRDGRIVMTVSLFLLLWAGIMGIKALDVRS